MIKWLAIGIVVSIVIVIAIRIIIVMIHTEKESKTLDNDAPTIDYIPETVEETNQSQIPNQIENLSNGFKDELDNEFAEYSNHAHNPKSPTPIDFDLDGEFADDELEYQPNQPDLNFFPSRRKTKKATTSESLNNMPTELKVLMLSDIFDRKF